jgi:hypothetical protein
MSPKLIFAAVILVIGGAGYYWYSQRQTAAPAATAEAPAAAQASAATDASSYDLPPLKDSDEFMRERVGALSAHPLMAAWLKTTDLARNLIVVLENTSRGLNPSKHLRVLKPAGTFRVVRSGAGGSERMALDPRNYERFNGIAEAAASIDAAAAGTLYKGLRPLLQAAYDELGNQEPLDRALGRAIAGLLAAPVVEGDIPLTVGNEGVGFKYVDPKIEALTGAQKQLVRMGPTNQRLIQGRLRQFATAAGITVS